jgi:hypothetical protein
MRCFSRFGVSLVLLLVLVGSVAAYPQSAVQAAQSSGRSAPQRSPSSLGLKANYGKLPLSFEVNQGQSDAKLRFQSRGQGYSFSLTDSGVEPALSSPAAKRTELQKDRLAESGRP